MNVLMLNYEYPPLGSGGAAVCRDISERLVQNGNKVTVVTMGMKKLPAYEKINGVNIYRVKCWRRQEKVCHPWEQLTYCFSAYFFIRNRINMVENDVVHCHFIIPTGLLAIWLKRMSSKKYILTAQGSDVLGHNNRRFGYLYRIVRPLWVKIVSEAVYLTAPSKYLIGKIHDTVPDIDCIEIPNGLNMDKYHSSNKQKMIITLSRLQESKGIQDLIEAVKMAGISEWKVVVIGTGPYMKKLRMLVRDYELEDIIMFAGYVSDEDHYDYLGKAGLFFSGSRFEAMPISVLEAMASNCNILASNIEPHKQMLPDYSIYTDIRDLAQKLQSICLSPPVSREYDLNKYDWDRIIKEYITLYEKCNG